MSSYSTNMCSKVVVVPSLSTRKPHTPSVYLDGVPTSSLTTILRKRSVSSTYQEAQG